MQAQKGDLNKQMDGKYTKTDAENDVKNRFRRKQTDLERQKGINRKTNLGTGRINAAFKG